MASTTLNSIVFATEEWSFGFQAVKINDDPINSWLTGEYQHSNSRAKTLI
jgi:hypothetical protein